MKEYSRSQLRQMSYLEISNLSKKIHKKYADDSFKVNALSYYFNLIDAVKWDKTIKKKVECPHCNGKGIILRKFDG